MEQVWPAFLHVSHDVLETIDIKTLTPANTAKVPITITKETRTCNPTHKGLLCIKMPALDKGIC